MRTTWRWVAVALLLGAAPAVPPAKASQVSLLFVRGSAFDAEGRPWGEVGGAFTAAPSYGGRLEFWPGMAEPDDRRSHWGIAGAVLRAESERRPTAEQPGQARGFKNSHPCLTALFAPPPLAVGNWSVRLVLGLGVGVFSDFGGASAVPFAGSADGHLLGCVGLAAQWRFAHAIGLATRAELLDATNDDLYGFPFSPGYSLQIGLCFWSE